MSDERTSSESPQSSETTGALYRAPDSVVREALSDEELVVLDSETHRFYSLNSTAKRVYELAVAGLDEATISQRLGEEFDIEPAECAADVRATLGELCEQGILAKATPAP